MPPPFSQTIRALNPHQNYTVHLLVAMVMIILWGGWFFFGEINDYVTSLKVAAIKEPQPVWRQVKGRVEPFLRYQIDAYFSKEDITVIHPGQQLILIHKKKQNGLLQQPQKAQVDQVDQEQGRVRTYLELPTSAPTPFWSDRTIQMRVAIAHRTPATLLFYGASHGARDP
ncbi:hypothetical protein ACQZV8_04895 [Magnetococcales bacterium HHB-1]